MKANQLVALLLQRLNKLESDVKEMPIPKDGKRGRRGPQGEPGESIVGPTGPEGREGPQGPVGPKGRDGIDGKDGIAITGPQGPRGPEGPRGPAGRDGIDGTPGAQGQPGRDGSDGDVGPMPKHQSRPGQIRFEQGKPNKWGRWINLEQQISNYSGVSAGGSAAIAEKTWIDYVVGYATEPTLLTTIDDGEVWQYDYSTSTLYRLIGNSEDTFYSAFANNQVSGVVASKAIVY